MIILSNDSNPATLKLLIAAEFGKQNVEIKSANLLDLPQVKEPKHLPVLQTEDRQLFISNAAAWLLFSSNNDSCVEEWMEWESSILRPVITQSFAVSSKIEAGVKTYLNTLFKRINSGLSNDYLTGKNVAVCDIAVWSTLYPLYLDPKLKEENLSSFETILKWIKCLESLSQIKSALSKYNITAGQPSYQALMAGECYVKQSTIGDVKPESGSNVSPTHQPEVATEEEIEAAQFAWNENINILKPKSVTSPVLPKAGEKNILVTSALPYVNNVPHLGNIIGCVLSADVFTRFCRICNYNTVLICGTDEYGTATETKAVEEGLSPQQICDKYFQIHNDIYRWFGIGFDYFGRTTTPEQTELCQEMFLELHKNGFMQTQPVEQLLCEKCNRYLADRFVEGGCPHPGCGYPDARGDQCDGCSKLINAIELINPRCKVCNSTPSVRTSSQFFLDLPQLEPLLYKWMEKSSPGWSHNARVIGKTWMKEGLKPRCITRDLKWGIPVPIDGFRDKVFYVWFDAPIGYMSITKRYTAEWEKWWRPSKGVDVKLYQFMAKDNVPFHAVMFPAVLLGCNKNYVTVDHIMATEYLNYEDGKFSKSRSVGVFGNDAQNTGIPSDVWRFYLLYVRPESQDSSFNWDDLATKNNSELLNNLGNFINRALMFCEKFFDAKVPQMQPNSEDYAILALCTRELKAYMSCVDKAKLRDGIRHILSISRLGNQYMQGTKPWVLVKGSDEEKLRAGTVIGVCCNLVCLLATLLHPYMPETSRTIQGQLNAPQNTLVLSPEKPVILKLLSTGHSIGKPVPLFTKIEQSRIDELKGKFGAKQEIATKASEQSVSKLQEAVTKQGEKVRTLKAGGDKKVWQPEVAILLELKKKLVAAEEVAKNSQKQSPSCDEAKNGPVNPTDVKDLEAKIAEQGEKVRTLKAGGDKKVWQPEVAILLELKKKLVAADEAAKNSQKHSSSASVLPKTSCSEANNGPDVKFLEAKIAEQGNLVRNLKTNGAPKTEWQPQVTILQSLKAALADLTGVPIAAPGKKSKK